MVSFIKKHKKLAIVLLIVILVVPALIQIILLGKNGNSAANEKEAVTILAEKRDLSQTVSTTGVITSIRQKSVSIPAANGLVLNNVNYKVGDYVKEGDILASFDTADVEKELADVRKNLELERKQAGIGVENANSNLQQALQNQLISDERARENVDKATAIYNTAQGEYEEAQRVLQQYENTFGNYYNEDEYHSLMQQLASKQQSLTNLGTAPTVGEPEDFLEKLEELKQYMSTLTDIKPSDELLAVSEPSDSIKGKDFDYFFNVIADPEPEGLRQELQPYLDKLLAANDNYLNQLSNAREYKALSDSVAQLSEKVSAMANAKSQLESARASAVAASQKVNSMRDNLETANDNLEDSNRQAANSVAQAASTKENADLSAIAATVPGEKQVDALESQLAESGAVSPIAGIITAINYEKGDIYTGAAPLLVIEDNSSLNVAADIDEYDINKIKVGQRVTFTTKGTGEKVLEGRVSSVAPRANQQVGTQTGNVTYRVVIAILGDTSELRMDMTAKVNIILEEVKNAVSVPIEAVIKEENHNYVLDGNGNRIPVTLGMENGYYVEIKSRDIKAGTVIRIPEAEVDLTDIETISDYIKATGDM